MMLEVGSVVVTYRLCRRHWQRRAWGLGVPCVCVWVGVKKGKVLRGLIPGYPRRRSGDTVTKRCFGSIFLP